MSNHTCGCGWNRQGWSVGSNAAYTTGRTSTAQELSKKWNVASAAMYTVDGQPDADPEDHVEPLAVEAQVHEEQHDHDELDGSS